MAGPIGRTIVAARNLFDVSLLLVLVGIATFLGGEPTSASSSPSPASPVAPSPCTAAPRVVDRRVDLAVVGLRALWFRGPHLAEPSDAGRKARVALLRPRPWPRDH